MEKIIRHRLYEQVADKLEEAIFLGKFKVGEKLPPERTLAEDFGVNRLAVREALRTLETKRMVRTRTGEGTFVTSSTVIRPIPETLLRLFTEDQLEIEAVDELFLIRRYLEIAIVKNVGAKITDELIQKLRHILDYFSQSLQAEDREKAARHDEEFHLALAGVGDGKVLSSLAEVTWEIIRKYQRIYFQQCASPEKVLIYLNKVLKCLTEGEINAAAQTMEELLIFGDQEFRSFLLKES